jgi:hypothetical protein
MENILDLSVILPIKSNKEKDFEDFFSKCISSLKTQQVGFNNLIIIYKNDSELESYLKSYDYESLNVEFLPFDNDANYSEQVNLGVSNSKSEWVSFFEFDDEYSPIWFKNVKKYSEVYPEVGGFLPIVIDIDDKNSFAGFTNEATFANNFAMEVGYLTNETLHNYQNFQSSGMAIKKSLFEEFGGFKPSVKFTFVYEFLLRLTYNSVQIMTIPKIGYKHTNLRQDSIFWSYKFGNSKLSESEVKFWLQTAKKEYFFTEDRQIKYLENV